MLKKNCIIVGAGTYGQVYAQYLKEDYNIIGFVDDNETLHQKYIDNIKVLGNIKSLELIKEQVAVFIPIGNNKTRIKIIEYVKSLRFETPSFIHPTVTIDKSVKIGEIVYILANSSIMPLTTIENFVMISMGVNIAHHNTIQSGVFISQGANIGASLTIGKGAFIGISAVLMTGITRVGCDSYVGAGAVVIKDVPDGATVVGNPARIIKQD